MLSGLAFQASTDDIPAAGEVFYARLVVGIVGDICGGGSHVLPEFIPPSGVFIATSKRYPVSWRYTDQKTQLLSEGAVLGGGRYGGRTIAAAREGGGNEPWPLANTGGPLEVYVPLVSSRLLKGIGSQAPSCPQRENGIPCDPSESGDYLQAVAQTSCPCVPSDMLPIIGLFAGPPDKPTLSLRRGRRLAVTTAPLATVRVRAGGRRITRKAKQSGRTVVKLPRGFSGRVRVTATTTDGAVSKTSRLRVR